MKMMTITNPIESESPLSVRAGAPIMVIAGSDFLLEDYQMKISYGYCQCGCGNKSNIAKCTDKRDNVIKGQSYRFLDTSH